MSKTRGQQFWVMSLQNESQLIIKECPASTGGNVRLLRLNRPDALNSMSRNLLSRLEFEIGRASSDPDLRCLILTGTGRAFCTGADLKERATMDSTEVGDFLNRIHQLFIKLDRLPVPIIAALNGFALGGGLELSLCADIRIAVSDDEKNMKLGLTETSLGIIPGAGGTQRLSRTIGLPRAKELVLTARLISARRALEIGLVHEIVPMETLEKRAIALSMEITRNAPIALRQAKMALDRGFDTDLLSGLKIERECYQATIPTADRLEALNAFIEKRQPEFQGL